MTATSEGPGSDAVFPDAVDGVFGALGARGFVVARSSPNAVRLVGPATFVDLAWDRRSFDVSFEVGTNDRPADALTDYEVQLLAGDDVQVPRRRARDADVLATVLEDLLHLLVGPGAEALAGGQEVYQRARELRRAYTASVAAPPVGGDEPEADLGGGAGTR